MSEPIKPALTAEEWQIYLENCAHLEVPVAADAERAADFYGTAHYVAALALYGQPFGFTRKDVEMLQLTAERANTRGDHAKADVLLDLSERIEFLLPPEKK